MTNETIDLLQLAFDSTWGYTVILRTVMILMPLISLVVFTHGWRSKRRGKESLWHSRVITLAALSILTITILRILATIHYMTYYAAAKPLGSADWAMMSINISFVCTLASQGVMATAFCLALALLTPTTERQK